MQLLVRSLGGRTRAVSLDPTDTVADLKTALEQVSDTARSARHAWSRPPPPLAAAAPLPLPQHPSAWLPRCRLLTASRRRIKCWCTAGACWRMARA